MQYMLNSMVSFSFICVTDSSLRSEWRFMGFLTTVIAPSRPLMMTINVSLIMTCFPKIVIQNGSKNALWERRETGWWYGVKNLLPGRHLTAFPTTSTDPSHSLRMTINISLTTIANPLLLFRMTPNGNHMLRLLTHSWQLIADGFYLLMVFPTTGTDPSHSLRMTINISLTTTANPLLLFRMTPNGNHMLRLLTHS